jgi:hypothetical protein
MISDYTLENKNKSKHHSPDATYQLRELPKNRNISVATEEISYGKCTDPNLLGWEFRARNSCSYAAEADWGCNSINYYPPP